MAQNPYKFDFSKQTLGELLQQHTRGEALLSCKKDKNGKIECTLFDVDGLKEL